MNNLHKTPLIHYGNKKFREDYFRPIRNDHMDKPAGGLWTSPVNSEYGWIDWCKSAEFREYEDDNHFKILLKPEARVFTINTPVDLNKLPLRTDMPPFDFIKFFDFENLPNEYDAIHLTESGLWNTKSYISSDRCLMTWDCESVLIMNKDCFTIL